MYSAFHTLGLFFAHTILTIWVGHMSNNKKNNLVYAVQ